MEGWESEREAESNSPFWAGGCERFFRAGVFAFDTAHVPASPCFGKPVAHKAYALAIPPFSPPSLPNATAAGFFFIAVTAVV
jgi:hypothetical protein